MKSIGARLTFWYAITATATLGVLFVGGYFLLEGSLIHGLDLLNRAGYEQLRSRLGDDAGSLSPQTIEQRIRETTEHAKVLFYFDVHSSALGHVFRSTNLAGHDIPEIRGQKAFNVPVEGVGEVRASEFLIPPFDVMVATSTGPVRSTMATYVNTCAALLAAMLVASIFTGFGLSRLMLKPVRAIRQTALRIDPDSLDERIPVAPVRDEISDLARLLNQMFDRLAVAFAEVRRFTADASHELKTPLSLVRLHAEKLLMDSTLGSAQRESVQIQLEEVERLNRIIEELLFLSRARANAVKLAATAQDPAPFLQSFSLDAAALAEDRGCAFAYSHSGSGSAAFEAGRVRQVLLNLVSNALKVSPPGGRITLESTLDDDAWHLSVTDQGPGLEPEQRKRMFDPFVRFGSGAGDDQGSGLGLAICRSIVALHSGRIFAEPGPEGKGLRVAFAIPAASLDDARPA